MTAWPMMPAGDVGVAKPRAAAASPGVPATVASTRPFVPALGEQVQYINDRKNWVCAKVIGLHLNVAAGEAPYVQVNLRNNKTQDTPLSQLRPRSLAPDAGAIDDLVIDGPRGGNIPPYAARHAIRCLAPSLYVTIPLPRVHMARRYVRERVKEVQAKVRAGLHGNRALGLSTATPTEPGGFAQMACVGCEGGCPCWQRHSCASPCIFPYCLSIHTIRGV